MLLFNLGAVHELSVDLHAFDGFGQGRLGPMFRAVLDFAYAVVGAVQPLDDRVQKVTPLG